MSKINPVQISGGVDITGITAPQHETLAQLIHFLSDGGPGHGFASGAYKETIGQPFPSSVIWYTDGTKVRKIIEKQIVRNASQSPITITWKMYSSDGVTVINSAVDTIAYLNNVFETSRVRAIS